MWFNREDNSYRDNPFSCFDDEHHARSDRVGAIVRQRNEVDDFSDYFDYDTQEYVGKSLEVKRTRFAMFLVVFGLFLLLGKSFYLQVVKGDGYRNLAEKNRVRTDYIKTTRGLIYDAHGKLLVKNIPKFIISIIPAELPYGTVEKDAVIQKVSSILELDKTEVEETIYPIKRSSLYFYQPIMIKDNVAYEEAIKLSINEEELPGIVVQTDTYREYLTDEMQSLSHLLGYTGKINEQELESDVNNRYLLTDIIGKVGIEKQYEVELRGIHGVTKTEIDAFGREIKILEQENRRLGSNIVLTIDSTIQKNLEQIVTSHLQKIGKDKASVIALNPQNGEILAIVNFPSFDNNLFSQGIDQKTYSQLINNPHKPLFNRSVSGEYPSGSTFKMIMAAAGLQEGVINAGSAFLSQGGLRIGDWFYPDWKAGGHGVTNVRKALAESVNTFFYILGGGFNNIEGMGVDKISEYAKKFGLGKQLGIDLPNERDGFVPTREWKEKAQGERWYVGDTYNLSIGQGNLLVTPLQVATYTAAVANGGIVYRPHVVKEVINPHDKNIYEVTPQIIESGFIDDKNIKIVQQGLRQGVTQGSGRRLNYLPIQIAGKTGTAQWSSQGDPHAWFTSYAPYNNPEVVLTVLVEEGEEGSAVAVPIAESFYRFWVSEYGQ